MTNATATAESFWIPVERVTELSERVAKLNKKALKLGTPPIVLTITDNTRENQINVGGAIARNYAPVISWTSREVLLSGETPKLNGWEFLTVVLHRPAGNEFVSAPDVDVSEYLFRDKVCDHCHTKRVRNATFLVRHDDGQILQVGSSCLTDFTGVKSPQAHAAHMENILTMFHELRGGGWTQGRTTKKWHAVEFLAYVAMSMREQGTYVGSSRAYDTGEQRTADRAKSAILLASQDPNAPLPQEQDFQAAEAAVAWARSDEGAASVMAFSPDFAVQFLAVLASDDATVGEDRMGIAAPAIVMHRRWLNDQAKPESQYLGAVGDKLSVKVTIAKVTSFETQYGYTTLYIMRDEQGNLVKWYSSRSVGLKEGETATIKGTVKKHEVDRYNGENATILTRCKAV